MAEGSVELTFDVLKVQKEKTNKSVVLTRLVHELLEKKHSYEYIIMELEDAAKLLSKWQGVSKETRIKRFKLMYEHAKSKQ